MILLYTNVLSETMRNEPDERVMRWLDGRALSVTAWKVARRLGVGEGAPCYHGDDG